MNISVAASSQENRKAAIKEVVEKTKVQLGNTISFALVLAPESFPADLLADLKLALNAQSLLCGVSSAIFFKGEIRKQGLALICFASEGPVAFRTPFPGLSHRNEFEKALRDASSKKFTRQGGIIGFLPQSFPGDAFIAAVGSVFGTTFPCVGVYPHHHRGRFMTLFNDEIIGGSLTGGFIGGPDIQVACGSTHGFKPIGIPFQIQRTENNRVLDLDNGKPVYHMYQYYFQDKIQRLEHDEEEIRRFFSIYPLGFKMSDGEYAVTVPEKILVDGSLLVRGSIFTDRVVRLMFSTPAITLDSTKQLIGRLKARFKQIYFALIVESIHRLRILYPEAQKELAVIQEGVGQDIPVVGMISDHHFSSSGAEDRTGHHIINSGLTVMMCGV